MLKECQRVTGKECSLEVFYSGIWAKRVATKRGKRQLKVFTRVSTKIGWLTASGNQKILVNTLVDTLVNTQKFDGSEEKVGVNQRNQGFINIFENDI